MKEESEIEEEERKNEREPNAKWGQKETQKDANKKKMIERIHLS